MTEKRDSTDLPPEGKSRSKRIGKLDTVGRVAAELARLYREGRRGETPVSDVSRLANVLACLRQCLEASEIESWIAAMEAAVAPADSTQSIVPFRSRR